MAGSNNLTNFDHLRKIVNIEDTPNGFLKIPAIPVILPTLEWFLQRIENNDPYHFLRVNHATIDKYCWKFIISNATKIADNIGGVPTNPWENQLPLSKLDEYLTEGKYQEIWEGLMSQNSFGYFVNQKTHGEKLRTLGYECETVPKTDAQRKAQFKTVIRAWNDPTQSNCLKVFPYMNTNFVLYNFLYFLPGYFLG